MFADTADPAFYKRFAQSGISRPLSTGLIKELKDSGVELKNGANDLANVAADNPGLVFGALWNGVKGLPSAVKDSFVETGHAIGEGSAVALNEDISEKLNAIYGNDVSGYQQALLAIRTMSAAVGVASAAKAASAVGDKISTAVSKKLDDVAAVKTQAGVIAKTKVEFNARLDDGANGGVVNLAEMQVTLTTQVADLRATLTGSAKTSGNMGVAQIDIPGIQPTMAAYSRIGLPSAEQRTLGFLGEVLETFPSSVVPTASTPPQLLNRAVDSEAKMLNNIAAKLGNNTSATGTINLLTDRAPRVSCSNVIDLFKAKYPNITVNVMDNGGVIRPTKKGP